MVLAVDQVEAADQGPRTGRIVNGATMILAEIGFADLSARLERVALPAIAPPGSPAETGMHTLAWTAWGDESRSSAHLDWSCRLTAIGTWPEAVVDAEDRVAKALNGVAAHVVSLVHPGEVEEPAVP